MLLKKLCSGYFIRMQDVKRCNGHAIELFYKERDGHVYCVYQTGAVLVRGESIEFRASERVIRVNHLR